MAELKTRILVVDDDQRLRDLLVKYLSGEGYEVKAVPDARAMDKHLGRERYDLVVLDLMLPGEDGLAICRRLRGQQTSPAIIMLTAKGDDVDRIVGLEMGADDYLPKPFNPRELLARINAVLRRRAPLGPPGAPASGTETHRFGRFELSLATRSLTREGKALPLTTGEFSVLKVLVQHPREPLSRDKLMELARGREYEVFDRSIDVQISRLRKIVEDDPSHPKHIQTVSVINLTRAALVSADPFRRRQLLSDLHESEGLRAYPATSSERLEPLPDDPLLTRVAQRARTALGENTRFAYARDGEEGFWVSFFIDSDEFWAMLPLERFAPAFGLQWLGWGLGLLALALAGAWLIAFGIARPLAGLTRAAGRLGRGEAHQPVPEEGARELLALAAAFNRMASDLAGMERERAMVLAGISHDLRTPLSRLRLMLEMSGAESTASEAMITDVDEIDAVIGQFLEFARSETGDKSENDLNELLDDLAGHYARLGRKVSFKHQPLPTFPFARMAVRRAVANLVDNALRYAGEPVEIRTSIAEGKICIEVLDRGPG